MNSGESQVFKIIETAASHWHMDKDIDDISAAERNIQKIIDYAVEQERERWITPTQAKVLKEITPEARPNISTLAKNTGLRLSTVQKALEKLIDVGLVWKSPEKVYYLTVKPT